MVFIMEESICWRRPGFRSRIRRNGVVGPGDMPPAFPRLSLLKRKVRMWSRVLQQPVHTMLSGETRVHDKGITLVPRQLFTTPPIHNLYTHDMEVSVGVCCL